MRSTATPPWFKILAFSALRWLGAVVLLLVVSCADSGQQADGGHPVGAPPPPRFTLLDSSHTGITFANQLQEGPNTNVLVYEYFYNGGGVATADFDRDGRPDLYFTANMAPNALYLNRGDWTFEEVASRAQATGRSGPWQTGVAIVDINQDSLPDIYLSYSGMLPADKRRNQLLINQGVDGTGVPQFIDRAAAYGLASAGFTNQAYFVDYDGDNDLDCLLLNHNPKALPVLNVAKTRQLFTQPDSLRGLRVYRNDGGGRYHDVTEASGINGSALSYGLSLAVADYNGDHRPDIYVANDYEVPNYLYLNQGNGTFIDSLQPLMDHSAHFSMGTDAADLNNDGHTDLVVLDMLPADPERRQLLASDDNRHRHALNAASGYPAQTMRNMLHLNRGDHTYAETGRSAGISATDWSWSALLADFDNDGFKDLHVTNGYLRDYTHQDFVKYMQDFIQVRGRLQRSDVLELLGRMPASEVSDFVFRNEGVPTPKFTDQTAAWGLQCPSNSNGAVAVDLDNDGDLDLAVNTLNQPALLYRNETTSTGLTVQPHGPPGNLDAVGAELTLHTRGTNQTGTVTPQRGYLSSGPTTLHFGLGNPPPEAGQRISLRVTWSDGLVEQFVVPDTVMLPFRAVYGRGSPVNPSHRVDAPYFVPEVETGLDHTPATVDDLDRQTLLPHQLSAVGPVYLLTDVDGDGQTDLVVGADGTLPTRYVPAAELIGQPKLLPLLDDTGRVVTTLTVTPVGDGSSQLLVGYGGYHRFAPDDLALTDCVLPLPYNGPLRTAPLADYGPQPTSVLTATRHKELTYVFVGGGYLPGRYPLTAPHQLLRQDTSGTYRSVPSATRTLNELPGGAITDAAWTDLNRDGQPELVTVGHWRGVQVFTLIEGELHEVTDTYFAQPYRGWWNTLLIDDLNQDGIPDLVIGNEGLNSSYTASVDEPVAVITGDLDGNGSIDPLVFHYLAGQQRTEASRDEVLGQLTGLRKVFPNYASYAAADASTVIKASGASHPLPTLEVDHLASTVFLSGSTYRMVELPAAAQLSPVHTVTLLHANQDGYPDLLVCGNEHHGRLRDGPSAANAGVLLLNNRTGVFRAVPQATTGLQLSGDVRQVLRLPEAYLFGRYGQPALRYTLRQPEDAL